MLLEQDVQSLGRRRDESKPLPAENGERPRRLGWASPVLCQVARGPLAEPAVLHLPVYSSSTHCSNHYVMKGTNEICLSFNKVLLMTHVVEIGCVGADGGGGPSTARCFCGDASRTSRGGRDHFTSHALNTGNLKTLF